MNILKTLAVSALVASTAFAASNTRIKNTSTSRVKNSSFETFKKNFDLRYSARLRGSNLSGDAGADKGKTKGATWKNNNIRHRFDFKYNLANGDKILLRNDINNINNQESTMSNPTLGYETTLGKVWMRVANTLIVKKADRDKNQVAAPSLVAVYSIPVTNKFSITTIPWFGLDVYSEDNNARSAYLGNEIDLAYKFSDTYTGQLRYELEYLQNKNQDAITEMAFSYTRLSTGVNVKVNDQMNFFPGIATNPRKVDADSTTVFGEFNYTFF